MDKATEEILDGLRIAIETELTGHEFYKNTAKTTTDPMGKETFERMAGEEMSHFNYLRHQYKSVLEKGRYDFSKKLTRGHHKHAENPIFSEEIKGRIKDSHFEVSALTIGMKLEMDAMRYYRTRAEKAQDPEVKQFYKDLADWEQDHFRAFQRELEMLKEAYFQANNFIPT
ncbi:MAG: ferritin family protein [Desulfobacteraceae bacterium]